MTYKILSEPEAIAAIQNSCPIKTARLELIWPIRGALLQNLVDGINQSKAELYPFLSWVPEKAQDLEGYTKFQESLIEELNSGVLKHVSFAIVKDTKAIGSISITCHKLSVPFYEIGYWISSAHAGQGYMTEAVLALTDFLNNKLLARRVEICCDQNNLPSNSVAKKAGYKFELTKINDDRIREHLKSTNIYAKTWND